MRIVLLGGGGHATDVLGVIEAIRNDMQVVGVVADPTIDPKRFVGRVDFLGKMEDISRLKATHYVACAGYPNDRKILVAKGESFGLSPLTLIHPKAWLATGVKVGDGSLIHAGALISPLAVFGNHVYVSHGASVGHDTEVGSYSSVMPGACVSGDVILGEEVMIGSNAVVLEGIKVGAGATLAAGAVANKDIPEGVTAKGIPARW